MFSFTEVAKEASNIMKGGSLLTLTYVLTIPNYNVMGVCKSAFKQVLNTWLRFRN